MYAVIQLSHVYKTYPGPVHALKDVSLRIDKGEFLFITGPSGAGKTTLFKMLSAFDKPTSGGLLVAGQSLADLSKKQAPFLRRKIGVVFQDFKLLSDRTVFENIVLPLQIMGEKKHHIMQRAKDVLEQVGLLDKANVQCSSLSGGEQQRVAIARAIVHRPGLLIADEPTGNLDPTLALEIMKLFQRVNDQGTTVVIATHDYALLEKFSKRRIHLTGGQISEDFK
jgi:cell division transport system ATP-binding protein